MNEVYLDRALDLVRTRIDQDHDYDHEKISREYDIQIHR